MKVYGWQYNQAGMGDWGDPRGDFPRPVPRGSKVHWEGDVTGWSTSFFDPGGQEQLARVLQNAGFQVDLDYKTYLASWNDYRILVDVVTPVEYANESDVFSTIKGAVWTVYQNEPRNISESVVSRPYVEESTGRTYYPGAPVIGTAPDTQVTNPNSPNRCGDKFGLDWLACQTGLDSTAQQLGLGIGAGVALLVVGGVVLLMILKK